MDYILAQAYATSVRTHGDAELGCHEQDAQHLRDTRQPTRVDLAHIDRLRLQELLEDHAVVCVLARGDADVERLERLAHRGVPEDVVGRRGLLDEPRLDLRKRRDVVDCDGDVPHLVGVDHEHTASRAGVLALQGSRAGVPGCKAFR